ncbi:MAG: hypothetical protein ABI379_01430 [Rhodanobacter sp.]
MGSGQLFVLAIIIIACAAGVIKHYLRLQVHHPRENPQYQTRIDALERRVQTLERIVTDQGYDLKREFDKL